MKRVLIGVCILMMAGLGVRAAADHETDGQEVIIKKVYREPLTTSRVNTASTRAVDARRAAESGLFVRQPARAYVVRNPTISQRVPQRYEPATRDVSVVTLVVLAEPRVYRDRPTVIAHFVNQRFDPVYDNTGVVRAQPPVARAQKGIEPAHHRAYPRTRNQVYHVTSDGVIGRQESAAVIREPVVYLLYPNGEMFPAPGYGVRSGDDYGYDRRW